MLYSITFNTDTGTDTTISYLESIDNALIDGIVDTDIDGNDTVIHPHDIISINIPVNKW